MNFKKIKRSRNKRIKNHHNLPLKKLTSRYYIWAILNKMQTKIHNEELKNIELKCKQAEARLLDKRKKLLRDSQKLNNKLLSNYLSLGYNTNDSVRTGITLLDMTREIWHSAPKRIKKIKINIYQKLTDGSI